MEKPKVGLVLAKALVAPQAFCEDVKPGRPTPLKMPPCQAHYLELLGILSGYAPNRSASQYVRGMQAAIEDGCLPIEMGPRFKLGDTVTPKQQRKAEEFLWVNRRFHYHDIQRRLTWSSYFKFQGRMWWRELGTFLE